MVFTFFLVVLRMVNFWDKLYHHEVTVVLCTTDEDIDDNDLYQIQYSQNRAEWKLDANELFKKRVILVYLSTIILENLVFLLQYYTQTKSRASLYLLLELVNITLLIVSILVDITMIFVFTSTSSKLISYFFEAE